MKKILILIVQKIWPNLTKSMKMRKCYILGLFELSIISAKIAMANFKEKRALVIGMLGFI